MISSSRQQIRILGKSFPLGTLYTWGLSDGIWGTLAQFSSHFSILLGLGGNRSCHIDPPPPSSIAHTAHPPISLATLFPENMGSTRPGLCQVCNHHWRVKE